MTHWYVVHTHALKEATAAGHLRRQGFDAYVPMFKKTRRHARKTDVVRRPLFPRYIFVRMDLQSDQWRKVRSTVGVVSLVSAGDRPMPLDDAVVAAIKAREDSDGCVRVNAPDSFQRGQPVRVSDGPFVDQYGLFDGVTDSERVIVLLNLLGREVRVQVSLQQVRKVA